MSRHSKILNESTEIKCFFFFRGRDLLWYNNINSAQFSNTCRDSIENSRPEFSTKKKRRQSEIKRLALIPAHNPASGVFQSLFQRLTLSLTINSLKDGKKGKKMEIEHSASKLENTFKGPRPIYENISPNSINNEYIRVRWSRPSIFNFLQVFS